jgi:BTB/POZ domain
MATAEDSAMESAPAAQETEPVIDKFSKCSMQTSDRAVADRDVIDEDGDVLIQSGSKELLVSSKILSLASPVFKAMFNSRFREGSTARSAQNPLKLPLAEDDLEALAVLFHTLHFSTKWKSRKLGLDLQLEIAQLCDKYHCTTSIDVLSEKWLRSVTGIDHDALSLLKASTIAFLMGNAEQFASFTGKLALTLTADDVDGPMLVTSYLPETLIGSSCP